MQVLVLVLEELVLALLPPWFLLRSRLAPLLLGCEALLRLSTAEFDVADSMEFWDSSLWG